MTNFEYIKSLSINELANLFDLFDQGYDNTPWSDWFSKTYCNKCESIVGRYKDDKSGREYEFGWCELNNNKCKYFQELDEIPDNKEMIKLWLEAEVYET